MMNQSAQGLASLGRGNDSMLVHMTPREVEGLQGLAMAHGGSLTVNPQTGLPEAGFLDSVLPMVGGAALSPFMGPMAAGLLIGGVTALTSGDIGKGLMAGLGGYGGADLGKIFTKMGASGGIPVGAGADVAKAGIAESLPMGTAQNLSMFTPSGTFGNQTMNAALTGSSVGSSAIPSAISPTTIGPGVNSAVNSMGAAPTSAQLAQSSLSAPATPSLYGDMGKGFGKLIDDPFGGGFEAFKEAGGKDGVALTSGEAAFKLGSPVAGLALSGMEPEVPEPYVDPETGKWRGPQGQLNLSDKYSSGLRLVAEGGYIDGYAGGGTVATGGIRDLYGSSDNQVQAQAPISTDGYGLGRLSNLSNEQAMTTAQTLGYADGGYLNGKGDGMSDSIPATIEGKQPARLADGEFVIPADVVSHLGNGSSKAGSKRLYAMLDKVRHARTGNKKQGKEINPNKYMPA